MHQRGRPRSRSVRGAAGGDWHVHGDLCLHMPNRDRILHANDRVLRGSNKRHLWWHVYVRQLAWGSANPVVELRAFVRSEKGRQSAPLHRVGSITPTAAPRPHWSSSAAIV